MKKLIGVVLLAAVFYYTTGAGEVRIVSPESEVTVTEAPGSIIVRDKDGKLLYCRVDEKLPVEKKEEPESPGLLVSLVVLPFAIIAAAVSGVCMIVNAVVKANI